MNEKMNKNEEMQAVEEDLQSVVGGMPNYKEKKTMSEKIKDTEKMNENKEITAENLEGVVGGKKIIVSSHKKPSGAYGENWAEIYKELKLGEIEKIRKEIHDEEINQVSDLGTDKSSSTR